MTLEIKEAAMGIPRTDLLEGRVAGCQRVKPTGASQDFAYRTPGLITRSQSRNRADLVGRTSWHPVGGKRQRRQRQKTLAAKGGSSKRQRQRKKADGPSQKRRRRSRKKAAEGSKNAAKQRKGNEGSSGGKAAEGSEGHRGPKAAEGSGGPKAAEGSKSGKGRKATAKEDRRRKVFRFVLGNVGRGDTPISRNDAGQDLEDSDVGILTVSPTPNPIHGVILKLAEIGRCGAGLPERARSSPANEEKEHDKHIPA